MYALQRVHLYILINISPYKIILGRRTPLQCRTRCVESPRIVNNSWFSLNSEIHRCIDLCCIKRSGRKARNKNKIRKRHPMSEITSSSSSNARQRGPAGRVRVLPSKYTPLSSLLNTLPLKIRPANTKRTSCVKDS